MKCPKCGYVSFDELDECKQCGASLVSTDTEMEEEGPEGSELQKELFSLTMGDDGEEEGEFTPPPDEERAPEGNLGLPSFDVDFDPATAVDDAAVEREEPEHGFSLTMPAEDAAVIDDEAELPEDLWVEEGAGFWRRLAAFAVDAAILAGVLALFFGGALAALSGDGYGLAKLRTPEGIAALFIPFYLLGLFVSLLYFTFFLGWNSRTPGKVLLGLDVRRTDGGPMTYTRAFLRWVGYLVSITFAGLGFLWIFFDERRRGWHDYLSGTWVKDLQKEG